MSYQPQLSQPTSVLATTWGKLTSALVTTAILLSIATECVIAYRSTQEAITAKATADNAAVRQVKTRIAPGFFSTQCQA